MTSKYLIISMLLLPLTTIAFAADEPIAAKSTDSTSSHYTEPSQQMLQDFEHYVQKTMKDWDIPGMAIGIVFGDKVIYTKGFGVKTHGSDDPVDADTIFQIGSITKSFTSTLTAMLVDEGKFKWDDEVIGLLPEFMMFDPWVTRQFQVVDLMAQRSGLQPHAGDSLFLLGFDRDYIKHAIRYLQPVSSFRTQYSYINVLFLYVADLIKKVTGKSWEQNVEDRLFKPLGMSNSSVDMQSYVDAKNVASKHVRVNDKMVPLAKDWPYLNWSYIAGPSGSINSNITDMVKWLSFQMNQGQIHDKPLVTENNLNFTHSPKTPVRTSVDGKNLFYALGWVYQENDPLPIIWHDGEVTGMKSTIAFVPKAKLGIVILSNTTTEAPELLGTMRFFDQYFGKELVDYSGQLLAVTNELIQEAKNKEPVQPENPSPPLLLEQYTGNYFNKIYGPATVTLNDGKLSLSLGNNGLMKMALKHWNRDIFQLFGSITSKEEKNGFAKFNVDVNGNVQSFTLDEINETFEKVAK